MRRKTNAIVAIVITMIAAAASSVHWLARPHLFTLLFLVLFYGALENVRAGKTRFAGIPYLVILPAGHHPVDQPARRILRGHPDDGAYGVGELLTVLFSPDLAAERRRGAAPAAGLFRSAPPPAWRRAW